MTRKIRRISQEQAASRCAWCTKDIGPDDDVYSVGARARPWVRLPDGGVMELYLGASHRRVPAIVALRDSPARQAGNDLLFAACSPACAEALTARLTRQVDFETAPGIG